MKIPQKIKPWIKILGLGIGIIADGIMLFACFTSQAHDLMGQIAFGALGIMIILLIPITYEERSIGLWFCLVLVAVFFDTSYLLATTRPPQPNEIITLENDKELPRLGDLANKAQENLDKKLLEYDKAMKVDTREQLNQQIIDLRADVKARDHDRDDRRNKIERGEISAMRTTAKDIFEAIPNALRERFLHLLAYGLISIIIQGMIVFSLNEGTKKSFLARFFPKPVTIKEPSPPKPQAKKPKRRPSPTPDPITRWVDACWVGAENGRKDIISRSSFEEFYRTRGGFSAENYDAIKQAAIDEQVIDSDGIIIIKNKKEAAKLIAKNLDNLRK